ncbi:MAG TPA: hypothetical protein VMF09_13540 [Solirubrobacteraceae bacterium]|nr:hypothetical protein [Solirubrobacteraceae bacterium]
MRRHALAATVFAATLGVLGAPAVAIAGLQHEFAPFANCPVNDSKVTTCIVSTVTGGEFVLGSKTVAIDKPVVLQGGLAGTELVGATNGETLSKTALTVPGGLVGIEGLGGEVTATAELAGAVGINSLNLLTAKGTAVSLPLKVKLGNPLLGSTCFIGSDSEPVAVELTTGTTSPPGPNKPITGSPGHLTFTSDHRIVLITGNALVGNSFSVPGANGCGGLLFLLIDPLVDLASGVPASAGHNTAVMKGTLQEAATPEVKAQLGLPEIGRCVPAESTGEGGLAVYDGAYENRGCTVEEGLGEGEYEWVSGPGAQRHFHGAGGKTTLEGVGGAQVSCRATSVSGEYTGAKTVSAVITLKGCVFASTKQKCESARAPAGQIVTNELTGTLGFIKDEVAESSSTVSVGLDLSDGSSLLSAECVGRPEALVLSGSAIAPIGKLDKMSSSFSADYKARAGLQEVEAFEEAPKDTLLATLGSGVERAGLTSSRTLVNEEPLEIRAEHTT